ncbi:hypothetical protein [Umezawaea beigongshangensis]|uniref:hypothetical protein n=1 Tax=Umezawaea beigongshangensis TaxID=2780383 RepID=UPI0018F1956B|nr:hypothetical protein [Umezawaea beigongshangensis]
MDLRAAGVRAGDSPGGASRPAGVPAADARTAVLPTGSPEVSSRTAGRPTGSAGTDFRATGVPVDFPEGDLGTARVLAGGSPAAVVRSAGSPAADLRAVGCGTAGAAWSRAAGDPATGLRRTALRSSDAAVGGDGLRDAAPPAVTALRSTGVPGAGPGERLSDGEAGVPLVAPRGSGSRLGDLHRASGLRAARWRTGSALRAVPSPPSRGSVRHQEIRAAEVPVR